MRDETNVLIGVVGSSRRESMQHRFPDMGEVVINQQNVGQLAARQPPAQVGCCDNPSDLATYHNDTVHIACPSTPFLPRMGEVKQEPSSLTCSRFNVRRRITEIWGAKFGMSRKFFQAGYAWLFRDHSSRRRARRLFRRRDHERHPSVPAVGPVLVGEFPVVL